MKKEIGVLLGLRWRTGFFMGVLCSFLNFAHAHVPTPGQIVRYQPSVLYRTRPFDASGQVQVKDSGQQHTLNYRLSWLGPETLNVELSGLNPSFYARSGSGTLKLFRRPNNVCRVVVDAVVGDCGSWRIWGASELSGNPGLAKRVFEQGRFLDGSSDPVHQVGITPKSGVDLGVFFEVWSRNATSSQTLLKIRDKQASVDSAAWIGFEQDYLAPVVAVLSEQSKAYRLEAAHDSTEELRGRNHHRLSTLLNASADTISVQLQRKVAAAGTSPRQTKIPNVNSDIVTARQALSDQGAHLLNFLLLTH